MNDKHLAMLNQAKAKIYKNFNQSGDLYQLENDVLHEFRKIQADIMEEALRAPDKEKKNVNAERTLTLKGIRAKTLLSVFGKFKHRYRYYVCRACGRHQQHSLVREQRVNYGKLSPKLTEFVCLEAKDSSFQIASEKLICYLV